MVTPLKRCPWSENDPLYVDYHDREWGVPVHDDRKLFEFLVLEGMQAGLSWLTILRKRENFRLAFAGFDPEKVARFGKREIGRLMSDAGIVRNELKILAAVANAEAVLRVRDELGSFDKYLWQFVDGAARINRWRRVKDVPATTPQSDAMSRDLKGRGFKFVGSTICYAHMQATGMVNDHLTSCFRYRELSADGEAR
jgi:DNA-3-methyladenine glycosylase I